MDHVTGYAMKLKDIAQALRDGETMKREATASFLYAEQRKQALVREGLNLRTGLRASAMVDLRNEAPAWAARNEQIARQWGIVPMQPNGLLLDETLQTREMTTTTPADGGFLVEVLKQLSVQEAHDTVGQIFDLMTVETAQGNQGNVFTGKLETLPTVSVLASETTNITEQSPAAGQAALSPKNLASYGRHSRQWALQSEAGAAALTRLHVNAVKSKALQQILEGTGSNGQLLGLTANSDVPTAAGTSVDWAKTCAAMESVEKTGSGPFAWVVSAAAAKLLRQRAQISGGEAILRDGRIGGYPCYVTGCTTSAIAAFGSWTDLQVFQWRPIEVAVDPFTDFQSASIGMRAWLSVDAAPMLLNSFYTLTAIT